MTLVAIDNVRTDIAKPVGTAFVNPIHVVSVAQPLDNPHGWTHIFLDSHDAKGTDRSLTTAQDLHQVLAMLGGTFIKVERLAHSGDNWPVWYVRTSAIVALQPTGEGRGHLYLQDGTEMSVIHGDVAASLERAAS